MTTTPTIMMKPIIDSRSSGWNANRPSTRRPEHAADQRQRHGQHDDQRVAQRLEHRRHQQHEHEQREQEILRHRADDLVEAVGAAGETDRAVRQLLAQFRQHVLVDRGERVFERQRRRRIHRQRHRAAVIEAADLRRSERGLEFHQVADRHHLAARRDHRRLRDFFRRLLAAGAQDDRHALLAVEIFAEP